MRNLRFAMVTSAALALAAWPVSAAEYNFTVPVDVRSLHPTVTRGMVSCSVSSATRMIGDAGRQPFTLTGGSFRGDVEVRVTTPAGSPAAVSWSCSLRFYLPMSGIDGYASDLSNVGGRYFREEFRRAPGAEFRGYVEGRF